jgi:hypothetical protein
MQYFYLSLILWMDIMVDVKDSTCFLILSTIGLNFYQLVVPSGRAQLNVSSVMPFAAGLAVVLLADLAKKASFFEGREARPARRARRVRVHDLMSAQERFKIAMQGKQVERTSRLFTN